MMPLASVTVGLPPCAISIRRLFAPTSGERVEALDRVGKRHRGVGVALGKVKAKSAGDQCRADQKQYAEREHRDGWIDDLAHRGGECAQLPCATTPCHQSIPVHSK